MIDIYFKVYEHEPSIAINIASDLKRLIGCQEKNIRVQKKIPNVLFMNILTFVFDFGESRKLLKRMSKKGEELSYDPLVLRQINEVAFDLS